MGWGYSDMLQTANPIVAAMFKTISHHARAAIALAMAALVPLASVQAAAPAQAGKPVIVGLDGPKVAACASLGEVRGLAAEGDLRLSVLVSPSATAVEIDQLRNGAPVILCDSSRDGKWSGIVYPTNGQTLNDCGLSGPVAKSGPYRGPCRSGWVASTFVVVTAG